jgi:hypothetical protein
MLSNLNKRDKRALKMLFAAAVLMFAFLLVRRWCNDWTQIRQSIAIAQTQLATLDPANVDNIRLKNQLPAFIMPKSINAQKFAFRDKLCEQFKKANLKVEPLQDKGVRRASVAGYKTVAFTCKGKGNFGQLMDLLSELKANGYLANVEELKFKCDPKKRQSVEFELTAATIGK